MNGRLAAPEATEVHSTPRALDGRGLTTAVLVVAFVLMVLAVVVPGGSVGDEIRGLLGYAFGWGSYVAPVVVGALVTSTLRARLDPGYTSRRSHVVGWLLIIAGLVTVFQAADPAARPVWGSSRAGGWLGSVTWTTLVEAFGSTGGLVLALAIAPIGLGLVLDVQLEDVGPALRDRFVALIGWIGESVRRIPRSTMPPADLEPASPLAPPFDRPIERRPTAPSSTAGRSDTFHPPDWQLPSIAMLRAGTLGELSQADVSKKIRLIEDTLADFDVYAKVVQVNPGPTITQFGLEPGFRERVDRNGQVVKREKIKVSEITSLQNDLALALAAPSIRIEAPVPGRTVVGLEVPNSQTVLVSLRQVVESSAFGKARQKTKLAVALGEDVSGQPVAADLARMPHLLIAGATGSGKSICINAIISCLLLQATPDDVRLILVDPKRVELTTYNDVPHLLRPVVVDADKVVGVLKWVVHEMDERYRSFEKHGVRNIDGYNKLAEASLPPSRSASPPGASPAASTIQRLPYIVVVIDELADLMMLAPDETERLICRLAQLARATGIHLVVATQRPSVDVITGLIKANFPTRISFAVSSQIDSRTILDKPGAEKLLGRGDMLYMPTDAMKPIRLQGVFVSDEEIEQLVRHWKTFGPPSYVDALVNVATEAEAGDDVDELFDRAVELSRETSRLSASFLQRRLRIGHNRAARLLEQLEERGVLPGPGDSGEDNEILREATP